MNKPQWMLSGLLWVYLEGYVVDLYFDMLMRGVYDWMCPDLHLGHLNERCSLGREESRKRTPRQEPSLWWMKKWGVSILHPRDSSSNENAGPGERFSEVYWHFGEVNCYEAQKMTYLWFEKVFGQTRPGNQTKVYRLRSGRSNHIDILTTAWLAVSLENRTSAPLYWW